MPEIASGAPPEPRLGERVFSFAVVADTHLNQDETTCNSPFEVNRLANARMRHVVRELNAHDVAFVVHLGDLVHPVPALPDLYASAARRFHDQIEALRHPIHLVPGNHDVGDKPIDWGPASIVTDRFLELWGEHFGSDFYAFDHGDCRFFVVNAQIINSGLESEGRQREWLERELEDSAGKRLFVNIHYPPYICREDEDEHYDNIAEPGRGWLLGLLERHGVEALFAGHVHNFWYNRHGSTDCYLLPSTAFVRHDYSDMYRIEPGPEAGRNDHPKLGYFVVHVHERGHVCHVERTYGATAEPDSAAPAPSRRVTPVHPLENPRAPLGFDMRQSWAEVLEIPPGGGLDEFDRKLVRNDYPLMAIWEMGVRRLRVPLRDLLNDPVRERMRVLRDHGLEFTLFSFGPPGARARELVAEHADLLSGWEIGASRHKLDALTEVLTPLRQSCDVPLFLTKLRSKEEQEATGDKYYHLINHGFLASDAEQIAAMLEGGGLSDWLDGLVFRVSCHSPVSAAVEEAGALAVRHELRASLHLRMGAENPAEPMEDDLQVSNRIAEALLAARVRDDVGVFVDTLADVDRGYFVRRGVLNRRYNPRMGFHVVRNLHGAIQGSTADLVTIDLAEFPGGRAVRVAGTEVAHVLLLTDGEPLPGRVPHGAPGDRARLTDLVSGEIEEVDVRSAHDGALEIVDRSLPAHPMLLTFD